MRHTPGPWLDENREWIHGPARLFEIHENALLMGCAPELLAALRQAELFIEEELTTRQQSFLPDPTEVETGYLGSAQSALDAVRAAIAKATGDTGEPDLYIERDLATEGGR